MMPGRCAHLTYARVGGARCHCYACGRDFNRTTSQALEHRVRVRRVTLALFRRMARRNAARQDVPRVPLSVAIAAQLRLNAAAFCDGRVDRATFDQRARRLWDEANDARCADRVRVLVDPLAGGVR